MDNVPNLKPVSFFIATIVKRSGHPCQVNRTVKRMPVDEIFMKFLKIV
jgi:hypothetical protein